MPSSMVFAVGSIAAGGVVLTYGVRQARSAIASIQSATGGPSGSGSSSTGTPPTTSGPDAARLAKAAAAEGFNKQATAALIGNATQESGVKASENVPGCKGLFCWNPAGNPQAAQVELGNVEQQIALVAKTIGPAGIQAMNNAGSVATATVWFETHFERAGTPDMSNRIAAAEAWLKAHA